MKPIEETHPSLVDYYNKFNLSVSTEYKGTGKVHFRMNVYPEEVIQKHTTDNKKVLELLKDLRQFARTTFAGSPGVLDLERWSERKEKELGLEGE